MSEGDVETTSRIRRRELQRNSDLDAVLEVVSIVSFGHERLASGSDFD
jgi:hypothetical protein